MCGEREDPEYDILNIPHPSLWYRPMGVWIGLQHIWAIVGLKSAVKHVSACPNHSVWVSYEEELML